MNVLARWVLGVPRCHCCPRMLAQTLTRHLPLLPLQSFIDKFRFNAKRASLVQSRIKALERMEVLEEVGNDNAPHALALNPQCDPQLRMLAAPRWPPPP